MSNLILGLICVTPLWTSAAVKWSCIFFFGMSAIRSSLCCFGVPVLCDSFGVVGYVETRARLRKYL
jgi:hypothetical protein